MNVIDNNSMLLLQKSLDFVWQKQRITSENIANAETPGYKAKYVTFEDEFKRSLSGTEGNRSKVRQAIDSAKMRIGVSKEETMRLDGNNVNVDVENIELARTQIQYEYLLKQINDQFIRLKMVLEGK